MKEGNNLDKLYYKKEIYKTAGIINTISNNIANNALKSEIGYKLPKSYMKFYNDSTSKNESNYSGVIPIKKKSNWNIINENKDFQKYINPPKGIIPVMTDGTGNFYCLDYRKDTKNPSILYYDNSVKGRDRFSVVDNKIKDFFK